MKRLTRMGRGGLGSTVGAFGFLSLFFFGPQPVAAQTIAITNGEVHTVSGPVIQSGTVVMVDGLITAVGRDVDIPAGARIDPFLPSPFDSLPQT